MNWEKKCPFVGPNMGNYFPFSYASVYAVGRMRVGPRSAND